MEMFETYLEELEDIKELFKQHLRSTVGKSFKKKKVTSFPTKSELLDL
jgi:hypothetical protein